MWKFQIREHYRMENSKVLQTAHTDRAQRATHNVAEKCLNVWRATNI